MSAAPVVIGPATLYLGDAYAIRPTLGFHDADITDPPYAFRAEGGGRYRSRRPNMEHYRPDAEFYVHAWNRGYHPAGMMADLLRVSRITSPRGGARFDHPTTKPDTLMSKIVANAAGTSVCDAFMGTGSTGVAAIRAGKRFVGIERDPGYFATACARITAAAGEREAA